MSLLQQLMLRFIEPKASVLDIGFGSGRDLAFLRNHKIAVWGVDPTKTFVKYAREKFSNINDHFALSGLPDLILPEYFPQKFDAVLLIAVWMHIPKELQDKAARKICSLLNKSGKVILSYSMGSRSHDDRFFEKLKPRQVSSLFEKSGCHKIFEDSNSDGLGRNEIEWITEVYEKC